MTTPRSDGRRRVPRVVESLVALAVAVLLLGPALGRGVVVAYDMPWSPTPRLTAFALGIGTPAPRAVPGDAVITVLGMALGASLAQKALLVGLLVATGLGAARLVGDLVPGAGTAPRCVAVVAAMWNPFVAERLAIGQWVVLLGLATLNWALSGLLRLRQGGSTLALVVPVVLAGLGGVNPWLVVTVLVLPGVLVLAVPWRARLVVLLSTAGMGAVWALPALASGVRGAATGALAFTPVADTPFGVLASLLSGGGMWNMASHPAARSQPVLAAAATLIALVGAGIAIHRLSLISRRLVVVLLVPVMLAIVSATSALHAPWVWLVSLPGGDALRDSHKLVAVLVVLAAAGLGCLAARVGQTRLAGVERGVHVALILLPVAVLPTIAWGLGGRLAAVSVPDSMTRAAALVSSLPDASVGILPWNQYRRYPWNANRVSLSLMPRMIEQVTVYDDSLPLRSGVVAGEDARAAAVTERISSGQSAASALTAEGVRVVVIERSAGLAEDEAHGEVLLDTDEVRVVRTEAVGHKDREHLLSVQRLGWALTLATLLVVAVAVLRVSWQPLKDRTTSLLGSPP